MRWLDAGVDREAREDVVRVRPQCRRHLAVRRPERRLGNPKKTAGEKAPAPVT
jgi:hypothetical protein